MHPTIENLLHAKPVILDGGWGTEFQRRGLPPGTPPELWNLEKPEVVLSLAQAYVEAGSQIILTNTFGANAIRLRSYGLQRYVRDINRIGAELSRQASLGRARVFGSVGPSGKLLIRKEVDPAEVERAFDEQIEALIEGKVDGVAIETMSDLQEALIALRVAKQTRLPVVCSMVFDAGKDKSRTAMGQTPEQVAKALTDAGADVVGANCGQGIAAFPMICQRLKASTCLPIWMKPNAGVPELRDGQAFYKTSAEEFASYVPKLVEAGADFVGGCCGTTPDFIRLISTLYHR